MAEKLKVKFIGIDYWNRAMFKLEGKSVYLSNVEILFDYDATENDVREKISESNLTYHGTDPEDDPMGTAVNPDKFQIAWTA